MCASRCTRRPPLLRHGPGARSGRTDPCEASAIWSSTSNRCSPRVSVHDEPKPRDRRTRIAASFVGDAADQPARVDARPGPRAVPAAPRRPPGAAPRDVRPRSLTRPADGMRFPPAVRRARAAAPARGPRRARPLPWWRPRRPYGAPLLHPPCGTDSRWRVEIATRSASGRPACALLSVSTVADG